MLQKIEKIKEIKKEIKKDTGLTVDFNPNQFYDDVWVNKDPIEFTSKDCGILGPVFKSGELEINAGIAEHGILYIRYNYTWNHPRGKNDHLIRKTYSNGAWEIY